MSLSIIEKDDVMESLAIELESTFDRLRSHYGRPENAEQALLLPLLEEHVKARLLEYTATALLP